MMSESLPGSFQPDDHLSRLLLAEEPWYKQFAQSLRDTFRPEQLPPLDVTSKPVAVKSIWGMYSRDKRSNYFSLGIHIAVITLMALSGLMSKTVRDKVKEQFHLVDPLAPYIPQQTPKNDTMHGGGGGGDRSPTPAAKGKLPKIALKQFVPPTEVVKNLTPKLTMEPTIVAPPDTNLPRVNMANLGDPLAKMGLPSDGIGAGGGIGSGNRGGVGSGNGAGFGPGSGGGTGGGAYHIGGGVSSPQVLYKVDPEYSEEARKAKYGGTVLIKLIVLPDGKAADIKIVRSLGLGLDEKAIEAVEKWKFKPGMKNGVAVPVMATIEVNFRLL